MCKIPGIISLISRKVFKSCRKSHSSAKVIRVLIKNNRGERLNDKNFIIAFSLLYEVLIK